MRTPQNLLSLLLLLFSPACATSPEDVAAAAFDRLCGGDIEGFQSHLTVDSQRLFSGLADLAPTAFACPADADFSVRPGKARTAGTALVLTAEDRQVILVQEDGEWRIDLFSAADGLDFPWSQEESP